MGKRRNPEHSFNIPEESGNSQVRRTHAEIADQADTIAEIDLHGQTLENASHSVFNYVHSMSMTSETCCRIIHGKGTGAMQKMVSKELEKLLEQGIIEAYFNSSKYPGGATLVVFAE